MKYKYSIKVIYEIVTIADSDRGKSRCPAQTRNCLWTTTHQ